MTAPLSPEEGRILVALARAAIEERLFGEGPLGEVRAATRLTVGLEVPRGCFVTLEMNEGSEVPRLRGCIGSLEARLAAHEAAVEAALQAAFEDPRFEPLTPDEYPKISLSISVLTAPAPVDSFHEVVAGRDGVVLEVRGRRAIFLPEVAAKLGWDTPTLLERLCDKAGLPLDAWHEADLSTFRSERFASPPAEDRARRAR